MKRFPGKIFVIAGPSGVGESTITRALIKRFGNSIKIITTTSRKKRGKERPGVEYHFISKQEFEQKIQQGYFFEYTYVPNRDVYYGTRQADFTEPLKRGMTVFVAMDLVGARAVKKAFNATTIFIIPASLKELEQRILKRTPTISTEELQKRLAQAKQEMQDVQEYDYVVKNPDGKLTEAIEQVAAIVQSHVQSTDKGYLTKKQV